MKIHKKSVSLLFVLALLLFPSMVFAAVNSTFPLITSQPSTLKINQNYVIVWNVTDSANATINTTALFFVNNVNTLNKSFTNQLSNNNGSNIFNMTVLQTYPGTSYNYTVGDVVFVNITTVESSNGSTANSTLSSSLTVGESSTVLVARDSLNFLPAWGSATGSFLTNFFPAIFVIVMVLAIIGAIVMIITKIGDSLGSQLEGIHGHYRGKKK